MRGVIWRLRSPALAGLNLVLSAALLAVPALLGASHESVLALSVYLVSVQAGQASSVQTNLERAASGSVLAPTAVALTTLAVPAALLLGYAIPTLILMATAGLAAGLITGARANSLLRGAAGVLGYQMFLTARSAVWLIVICLVTLWSSDGPFWGTVLVWAVMLMAIWNKNGRSVRLRLPLGPVTVLGALAALAYRNDVNVVRAAAGHLGEFEKWHYTLVCYALVQAVVGFLTLQLVYARSSRVLLLLHGTRRQARFLPGVFAVAASSCAVVLQHRVGLVPVASLLIIGAAGVSVQSALVHVVGRSVLVYVGGGLGLGACLGIVSAGGSPAIALGVELSIISLVVMSALWRLPSLPSSESDGHVSALQGQVSL